MGSHIILVYFVALVACQLCPIAYADCSLRLDAVESATALNFRGLSAHSLVNNGNSRFPVTLTAPAPTLTFVGALFASLPGRKCPDTAEGWLQAVPSLQLASSPSPYYLKPLELQPRTLLLNVFGVPLNITDLTFNLTLQGQPGPPVGDSAEFKTIANILSGYVFSNTSQTGGANLQAMERANYTGTMPATFNITASKDDPVLTVTLPNFLLTFVGRTQGFNNFADKTNPFYGEWSGSLTFNISGRAQFQGPLKCSLSCGPFGRCITVNKAQACECECGWSVSNTTGGCSVPKDSCPLFESGNGTTRVTIVQGTGGGGDAGGGSAGLASAGTCPTGYGFQMRGKTCSKCAAGFTGPGCNTCMTDEACRTRTGGPGAICATGLAYAQRSAEKAYNCRPSSDDIVRVVGPVLPFSCKTKGSRTDSQNSGPQSAVSVDASQLEAATCDIEFRLGNMGADQTAVCTGSSCHFAAGNPDFVCDSVKCACPKGCIGDGQDYQETLEKVNGKVTLQCDAKSGECGLNVGSLDVKLDLICEAAECIDLDGPIMVGTDLPQEQDKSYVKPIVAAIPLMLLVLGAGVCGLMMARILPYLKPRGKGERTPAGPVAEGKATAESVFWATPENLAPATGYPAPAAGDVPAAGRTVVGMYAAGPAGAETAASGVTYLEPNGLELASTRSTGCSYSSLDEEGNFAQLLKLLPPGSMVKQVSFEHLQVEVKQRQQQGGRGWFALCGRGRESTQEQTDERQQQAVENVCDTLKGAAAAAAGAQHGKTGKPVSAVMVKAADVEKAAGPCAVPAATASEDETGGANAGVGSVTADGWKLILDNVGGSVRAGEVMGVLGPSGCGKSTLLLKVTGSLAGDRRYRSSGRVLVDGVPVPAKKLVSLTALVPQDDLLLRSLTVEECLTYSAVLRLGPALKPDMIKAKVDAVIQALHLSKVRGSVVWSGTGHVSVSGGERRRAAIGMELVTDPAVLVLDEPTSGLDAYTAMKLLHTLRAVAGSGRAVLMSLHQPSPMLFNGLDLAMLMAAGKVVYYGRPGEAGAGMARLGFPCPAGVTIAEHLLQVVSDPKQTEMVMVRCQQQQQEGQEEEREHPELPETVISRAGSEGGDLGVSAGGRASPLAAGEAGAGRKSGGAGGAYRERPLGREIGVLFWRSMTDMLRNPMLTAFHGLGGLVLGVLVGVIFYQVRNDTSGAQNRIGAIFFALALLAFTSVTSIDLIQSERVAAGREMRRNYYRPSSYALTKLVLDGLLLRALPALLYALPFYFLMGLHPGPLAFFSFLFIFIAFNAAVGALALALAAALDTPGKTIIVMNLVLLVGVLFAGFLANKAYIPWALRWLTYVSIFRYAWEAMVINELAGLYLYFTAPNVSITVAVKGEMFLQIIGVDAALLMVDISVLVAMYVGCCLFVVAVVWVRYGRRTEH